jgi:GH15 family glucan-1,4-alpha-glucosidase
MSSLNLSYSSPDELGLGVKSIEVILAGQSLSGAFVASPNFESYRYSWLRDGAYCAKAMDLVGQTESASRFHRWVEKALLKQRVIAESLILQLDNGEVPEMDSMLPTRYTLDGSIEKFGEVEDSPWPNYQLDGYGVWLDELRRHHQEFGTSNFNSEVVDLVARYLSSAWKTDCFDCWEELGDGQHAATLASVSAGLRSAGILLGEDTYIKKSEEIRDYLLANFVRNGRFCKGFRDDRVDASLLSIVLPFEIVDLENPIFTKTVEVIRSDLRGNTGGLYRYLGDTYYGGGEWILLTSWLGWYNRLTNNEISYNNSKKWVTIQATETLELPEQSTQGVQDPTMIDPWVKRWGPVASPLLWSHAMYLLMINERVK